MSRIRWHRISPGMYQAHTSALFDGVSRPVMVRVRYIPEWPASMRWGWELWMCSTQVVALNDGPEATKAEVYEAVDAGLAEGFHYVEGLGWCLRGE